MTSTGPLGSTFRILLATLPVALLVLVAAIWLQVTLAPDRTELAPSAADSRQLSLRQHAAHYARTRWGLHIDDPLADIVVLTSGRWAFPSTLAPLEHFTLIARAHREGQRADVFRFDVSTSRDGVPVRIGFLRQLTATDEVDERHLVGGGPRVAFSLFQGRRHDSVVVLDLSREPVELTEGWPWSQRVLNALTNLQKEGQLRGIERTQLYFELPPADVRLSFEDEQTLVIECAGRGRVQIDLLAPDERVEQDCHLTLMRRPKIEDPVIFIAVDLVRNLPFIGPERMAVIQRVAFDLLDTLKRQGRQFFGSPYQAEMTRHEGEEGLGPLPLPESVGEGLGLLRGESELRGRLPPPRIAAMVPHRWARDGQWYPVEHTIVQSPDGSPLFYQSRLAVDPERSDAEVHFVVWDPDRIRLGIVAGTEEPIPTTSAQGTGRIPRRPGEVDRLIGAFNGGFQSVHGTFGMIEEDSVIVPPVGDAATVATFTSDRVSFGRWQEGWLPPDDLVSMRQNLEPLVENGVANPYRRERWGWALGQSRFSVGNPLTVRTGVCRLTNGALAYAYGRNLDGQSLAEAMVSAGCDFGLHLDMNPGHTGFEYYQVHDDQGEVFDSRKIYPGIPLVRHPRYIGQDNRDFFYLVHRHNPLEDSLAPACPDGEPVPFGRLTSTGQDLPAELLPLLAPPLATALVDHPLCRRPELSTEVIRIPIENLRGRLSFYREPPSRAQLLADQGEIMIPVTMRDLPSGLEIDAEGRLSTGGQGVESIPLLPMYGGELPPDGETGLVLGLDDLGNLLLAVSTDPEALAATTARLDCRELYWLPREPDGAPAEIAFGDGRVRTLPGGRSRAVPSGYVLWLDFVQPEARSTRLDDLLGVPGQAGFVETSTEAEGTDIDRP